MGFGSEITIMKFILILMTTLLLSCNSNSNEISYLYFNKLKQSNLPIVDLADINKFNFKNISDSLNFDFCDSIFQYHLKYDRGKFLEITVLPPSGDCLEITDRTFIKILINEEGRFMVESKEVALEELHNEIAFLLENLLEEEYFMIKLEQNETALMSLKIALDVINSQFYEYYVNSNKSKKITGEIVYPVQPRTISIQLQ